MYNAKAEATADSSHCGAIEFTVYNVYEHRESAIAVNRYPLEEVYIPLRNSGERFRWKVPNAMKLAPLVLRAPA